MFDTDSKVCLIQSLKGRPNLVVDYASP